MDEIIKYAFETGALNQVILAVIALGATWFFFVRWWPEHIGTVKRRDADQKEIRLKEIDAEKEIELVKAKGQIEIYQTALGDIKKLQTTTEGLQATFNDFLQNILSQFMEDRRDLIDSQVFKNKDR